MLNHSLTILTDEDTSNDVKNDIQTETTEQEDADLTPNLSNADMLITENKKLCQETMKYGNRIKQTIEIEDLEDISDDDATFEPPKGLKHDGCSNTTENDRVTRSRVSEETMIDGLAAFGGSDSPDMFVMSRNSQEIILVEDFTIETV